MAPAGPSSATAPSAFSAVTTTGIYCRDGCSATPRSDHVVAYRFAAAAEAAGFRPCLRCRPYRSSEPSSWVGGSELVCRAVRLICDGALDEGTEAALATRLGVSARHLRRLFADEVGTTPDALARSRRAHFARRLLDETDLSVADIAFAAGFGSVRQMNRLMQQVFRASPAALRAKRRRADRLVADGGLDLRLPYRPPLAWEALLAYLAARAIPGVEAVDGDTYRRTITLEGHPGVVEVRPAGDGGHPDHLLLRAHLPRWEGLIHVAAHARRLFDLDADPTPITHHLSGDPLLRPRLRRTPGLRVPGAWDPFEYAVRAVLGQQVSVAAANRLAGRVVEALGRPVPGLSELGLTHTFPDAATVAAADLTSLGLPGARARAVTALATEVATGALDLTPGRSLDDQAAALQALPGLGPWTAQVIALRALGERDAFPSSDLGLRRAAGNGTPMAAEELERRSERWRPWRSYAAMHLWLGA